MKSGHSQNEKRQIARFQSQNRVVLEMPNLIMGQGESKGAPHRNKWCWALSLQSASIPRWSFHF